MIMKTPSPAHSLNQKYDIRFSIFDIRCSIFFKAKGPEGSGLGTASNKRQKWIRKRTLNPEPCTLHPAPQLHTISVPTPTDCGFGMARVRTRFGLIQHCPGPHTDLQMLIQPVALTKAWRSRIKSGMTLVRYPPLTSC